MDTSCLSLLQYKLTQNPPQLASDAATGADMGVSTQQRP